jgi:maltooligosyltrehalose trehalohydrolase
MAFAFTEAVTYYGGFDAQWLDDFHHAAYVWLDKHGKKRYEDFGAPEQLTRAMKDGFVRPSTYRL